MNARTAAALGLLSASVLGAALGHCRGVRTGMTIGYAYGHRDGVRKGDANARLDMVLDAPTEAQHYAGVVSGLPDAYDSAAFNEALLNGDLRDGLHEGAQS